MKAQIAFPHTLSIQCSVLLVTYVSTCSVAGVAHKNTSLNSVNKMANTSQRHAQRKLRHVYATEGHKYFGQKKDK